MLSALGQTNLAQSFLLICCPACIHRTTNHMTKFIFNILIAVSFITGVYLPGTKNVAAPSRLLLKNATVIDGNGGKPIEHTDILIADETIIAVGQNLSDANAKTIDLSGKTVMPALISSHVHIGNLKYTSTKPENYT